MAEQLDYEAVIDELLTNTELNTAFWEALHAAAVAAGYDKKLSDEECAALLSLIIYKILTGDIKVHKRG